MFIHFGDAFHFYLNTISFFVTERLALIRQQRADAAKKREEEKAGRLSNIVQCVCLCVLFYYQKSETENKCVYFSQRTKEG